MTLTSISASGRAGKLAGWRSSYISKDTAGSPVLLIHPINMRGQIWAEVVSYLSTQHLCVMPDLRGHGESEVRGDFGLVEWLEDCISILDGQKIFEPVHVVGGSLGGSLACCFAEKYPDRTLSITAIGSSLNFDGVDVHGVIPMIDELGVEGTFRKVFPTMTFGPNCSAEVIERGISLANPNSAEIVKRIWSATIESDSTSIAAKVSCPSLVISGEFDATCTPALGLQMARVLRTEQILLPDIGHMPMLECPEWTSRLLARHFESSELLASASVG